MTTLFENRRRETRVRLVIWGILLASLWLIWWGWDLSQSYGISPGDGGMLRPPMERYGVGGFVAGLGLLFAAGTMLLATHYALRVRRDGERLLVETPGALGFGRRTREFAVSQVEAYEFKHGQMQAGRNRVNAPWMSLRIAGRPWGYVLDLKAETILGGGLYTLTKRKPRKRRTAVARL